ncbi:MAG: N-acetylmuramoyl-L-alanine amidase [Candidatus Latescibacteria bacterium]|nr:N-acetylmuramoyl-L-alanine amidase [Candidatus Latescibacterota bacterium]
MRLPATVDAGRRAGAALRVLLLIAAAALFAAAPAIGLQGAPAITVIYPDPQPAERITPIWLRGVRYISTNDIARVFRATKYWRPELRKLSLRFGDHTIRLTVDAPVVLVDESAKNLVLPPRLVRGAVYVPEPLLQGLMEWGIVTAAVWDEPTRTVRFRAPVHTVRQAQLWVRGRVTEVSATLLKTLPPRVLYATPSEVRLLFEGGTLDTARVFGGGVVTSGTVTETSDGVEVRLVLGPDARGYAVSVNAHRLKVAVTDDGDLVSSGLFSPLEPISLGGADGKFRTVVIDPGHGGSDPGVALPGGTTEKEAALELARALRLELQDRLGARVVLTREGDIDLPLTRRSEIANEAGGELFVSLHFDAEGSIRSGGFRVYAFPPTATAAGAAERLPLALEGDAGGAELKPWDSAQAAAAGSSIAVGQAIADALARTFPQSRVAFRTGRIGVLEPIASPAVLLECAPSPRGGPEAMSLRGYSLRDVAKAIAQTIQDLARGGRV